MVIHKNSQDVISKTTKIVYSGIFFVIIPRLDRADGATRVFFNKLFIIYAKYGDSKCKRPLLIATVSFSETKIFDAYCYYSDKSPAYVLAALNNGVVSGESI